ncbi:hypothetical protein DSBG_2004 [Desulfosporosinus sp. BG]|nr:hypothetical protein DSBG_2004 [Desulfosporosinus sp. BG]
MQKKTIIITGVMCATLFIGGGIATAHYKPFADTQVAVASTATSTTPDTTTATQTAIQADTAPKQYPQTDYDGDSYPIPNDGQYHPSTKNPAGLFVREIIFHEGFRAKGLKALDVQVIARSENGENMLVEDRDEIVSATGTSGKVYDMVGSKGTGVTLNYSYKTYTEERVIQYIDVNESEKGITSVVVRRDGKLITVKPDKDTKYDTTYATLPAKATTTAPKATTVTTPAKVTPAPTPKYTATNPPMPPFELTNAFYGEIYDPAGVRKLAAWVIADPTARAYYKAQGNPTGATATYTNKTIIPLPPGYGLEHGGDYYDPDYLNAYADYQEWLVKPKK